MKSVPFLKVVNGPALRIFKAEYKDLTATQRAVINELVTTAVKFCYEFTFWPEAKVIEEIDTVSNVVPWADVDNAPRYKVWDAEPYTENSTALEVKVLPIASGLRLVDRSLDSVWVEYMPQPPTFQDLMAWESGAAYNAGEKVYANVAPAFDEYQRAYLCITTTAGTDSMADEPTVWQELDIYDCMAEPVKLLVMADLLGNSEQERAQAADLRQQADALLHEAWRRTANPL